MANTKEIQDRIKSINDTLKITNAMYMISSSKLKKSKKMLADTEPYFFTLQSEMSRILRHLPDMEDIYFKTNEDKLPEDRKVGYIVITADKGLAGSYNHNILKMAEEHLKDHPNHSLFVLGELGRHYFEQRGIEIEKQFHYPSDVGCFVDSSTTQFRIRHSTVPEILQKKFWSYIYITSWTKFILSIPA